LIETRSGARVLLINAMGRIFMDPLDDPFAAVERELSACTLRRDADAIVVDIHAEASSEKQAMGHFADGRASLVVGTHTHAPTADHWILPGGTAFITDVGMTGPHDSVIGVERSAVIQRFLTGLPQRFETATENPRLHGVVVTADEATGRATAIDRISLSARDIESLVAQPARAR
jgi:hypothetical protein